MFASLCCVSDLSRHTTALFYALSEYPSIFLLPFTLIHSRSFYFECIIWFTYSLLTYIFNRLFRHFIFVGKSNEQTFIKNVMGLEGTNRHQIWKVPPNSTEKPAFMTNGYPIILLSTLPAFDDAATDPAIYAMFLLYHFVSCL